MERRDFLTRILLFGSMVFSKLCPLGCIVLRKDGQSWDIPIDQMLAQGAKVMWVAAHPDDECFVGGILARASIYYGNPVYMLVLTRGEGGECLRHEGCDPDLGTVRAKEMADVARFYRARLQHESFWNAPLPVESFPKRREIYERWLKQGNPVEIVAKAISEFKPDIVLTFDPDHGATGHPEHQLASRVTLEALRSIQGNGALPRVYFVLNRAILFVIAGEADKGPVTEIFDATLPCLPDISCVDFMCKATEFHRTQANDMGMVRRFRSLFGNICLRRVDPFSEMKHPWD